MTLEEADAVVIGDRVTICSGGPTMTVAGVEVLRFHEPGRGGADGPAVRRVRFLCQWEGGPRGGMREHVFGPDSLKKV